VTFRLIQRHLVLGYLAAAAAVLLWLLPAFPGAATHLAIATTALGVAFTWVASGVWTKRERWAVRAQIAFVALVVVARISAVPEPGVAAAGLLVFMLGAAFLSVAHIAAQAFVTIRDGLVTIRAFTRVEAARQTLFYATFAAPFALGLAPGPISVAFIALSCFLVSNTVSRRVRRRLESGVARAGSTPDAA
jgi:hypothetical protein